MNAEPLLALTGVVKSYGAVRALRGATLEITRPGVVHTLMGQNGSGKSTLLGVLSGQARPDAGTIRLLGRPVHLREPGDAVRRGIAMVAQETAVAEDLTVAENVLLGRMVRTVRGIDWAASRRAATAVLHRLGLDYDPRWVVRRLRPDQKQLVEIARAVSLEPRVLVLDEPTSTLTDDEVDRLFATLDAMRAAQVAVLFVSHRLDEVFRISDELTVLRDGTTVSAGPADRYTPESVLAAMVGTAAEPADPACTAPRTPAGEPVLSVRALSSPGHFRDVDLDLHPGRIVGLAGLVGSGRGEVLEAIFGTRPVDHGTVAVDGKPCPPAGPRASIALGIGYLPPDRKTQGAVLTMATGANLTMVATHRRGRLRLVARQAEGTLARRLADTVRLKAASMAQPVAALSGGNQQKVVLGKWLATRPRVLLLDDPTRGVDVAAKAEIHARLRRAAADGLALLVTSSEFPELVDLCDEVVVVARGRVVCRLAGAEATEPAIAAAASGAAASGAAASGARP